MSKAETAVGTNAAAAPAVGWRFKVGTAIFAISLGWPALLPVLHFLGFSTATIAAFSGAMLVIAEIMMIIAVAVMGKPGFAYMKSKLFGVLKQYGPPKEVSRTRYRIGLVMFTAPILFGWASPYASHLISNYEANEFTYAIVLDVMLVLSLFVLGGEFWEKLRSLFIHGARETVPNGPVFAEPVHHQQTTAN